MAEDFYIVEAPLTSDWQRADERASLINHNNQLRDALLRSEATNREENKARQAASDFATGRGTPRTPAMGHGPSMEFSLNDLSPDDEGEFDPGSSDGYSTPSGGTKGNRSRSSSSHSGKRTGSQSSTLGSYSSRSNDSADGRDQDRGPADRLHKRQRADSCN